MKGMCFIMEKLKKMLLALSVVGLTLTVAGCGNDDEDRPTEKHGAVEVPKDDPGAYGEE